MKRRRYGAVIAVLALLLAAFTMAPRTEGDELTVKTEAARYADYTAEQLEDLLITTYGKGDGTLNAEIKAQLYALRMLDRERAARWQELLNCWERVNTPGWQNTAACPEGLREDGGLCFVVLGYQLEDGGSMKPELTGRLETALACAEAYPNAMLAVTGGGTALHNSLTTEADRMAEWLVAHGIAAERIIIENKSLTTVENAVFTGPMLEEHGIREVVVVTSDYHSRRGGMVFSAQAILSGAEYRVVSNCAYEAGKSMTGDMGYQTAEVRGVVHALREEQHTGK